MALDAEDMLETSQMELSSSGVPVSCRWSEFHRTAVEQRSENAHLVDVHFAVLSNVFVLPGSIWTWC